MPDIIDVTIVTAVYGDKYDEFIDGWIESVEALNPAPARVLIGTDKQKDVKFEQVVRDCKDVKWKSPYLWNECIKESLTEWVWVLDIDDRFVSNALTMLKTDADVVAVGLKIFGDADYIPQAISTQTIIDSESNYLNCGSPIRRTVWEKVGGYPEIAFTDWGMWRILARANAKFYFPNKVGYIYRREPANSMSGWAETTQNKKEALEL
jgi:hypothetical protein